MSDIQRWAPSDWMEYEPGGDFVKYTDYLVQVEALNAEVERLKKVADQACFIEPIGQSINDAWRNYGLECDSELDGSGTDYSSLFEWPRELADYLNEKEQS